MSLSTFVVMTTFLCFILVTLRKNDLETLDLNNLPTQYYIGIEVIIRDKIELLCLPVTDVFADSLISNPDTVHDNIQKRVCFIVSM